MSENATQIGGNSLRGVVPRVAHMVNLTYFYIGANVWDAGQSLPNLAPLRKLQVFYAQNSGLAGNLNDFVATLPDTVTTLALHTNSLVGIDRFCIVLVFCFVFQQKHMSLTGTFPRWTGFPQLEYISTGSNPLSQSTMPDLSFLTGIDQYSLILIWNEIVRVLAIYINRTANVACWGQSVARYIARHVCVDVFFSLFVNVFFIVIDYLPFNTSFLFQNFTIHHCVTYFNIEEICKFVFFVNKQLFCNFFKKIFSNWWQWK